MVFAPSSMQISLRALEMPFCHQLVGEPLRGDIPLEDDSAFLGVILALKAFPLLLGGLPSASPLRSDLTLKLHKHSSEAVRIHLHIGQGGTGTKTFASAWQRKLCSKDLT